MNENESGSTEGRAGKEFGTVQSLGSGSTDYKTVYCPETLEHFENKHPNNDYMVTLNCPEFTSLCPKTAQPDFATIYINYIPHEKLVESKSLKLYLFGFRNHGSFHEDCVAIIMEDLIKLMEPKFIEVLGHFLPRGGISIDPYASYGMDAEWKDFAKKRMINRNAKVTEVRNR